MECGQCRKPVLRGLLMNRLKVMTSIGFLFSFTVGFLIRYGHNEPRKKKYKQFYKTYDAKADFERMMELNCFQSVLPGEEVGGNHGSS